LGDESDDFRFPIIQGVCRSTEIETILEYGLEVLKLFPAESMGGVKSLKAFFSRHKGHQCLLPDFCYLRIGLRRRDFDARWEVRLSILFIKSDRCVAKILFAKLIE
jgi:hypothetical protein